MDLMLSVTHPYTLPSCKSKLIVDCFNNTKGYIQKRVVSLFDSSLNRLTWKHQRRRTLLTETWTKMFPAGKCGHATWMISHQSPAVAAILKLLILIEQRDLHFNFGQIM